MKKTVRTLALLTALLLLATALAGCTKQPAAPAPEVDPIDDNYRVVYQIFVGSFSDSDGDGLGDLRGVIDRLDYLNDGDINSGSDLGVQMLWLSPIFWSPTYHKYDAIDYYKVDPKFGDEETLKELVDKAAERNVGVILDLVINHTSTSCVWFQKFTAAHNSGNTGDPYYDWYSWADENSRLGGHSYRKIGTSDHYYECNFDAGMPELNFDNAAVRQEIFDIAKHYLELGCAGFRFDAAKYVYFGDAAKNVAFWKDFVAKLKRVKPDVYTVGEVWSGNTEIAQYYEALNCFDFSVATADGMIAAAANGKMGQIDNYTKYVSQFNAKIAGMRDDAIFEPFIANHDMDRAAGFVTVTSGAAYMAANILLLGPGSPTIYYGEEIGMKGSRGSSNTDANRRLAMLWGDGDTVRDPQGTTFDASKQINGTVQDQLAKEDSLLNYYAKVIAIRNRYPAIARGTYAQIDFADKFCGGFDVTYEGERLAIIHGTGNAETTVDLAEYKAYGFTEILETIGLNEAALDGTKLTVGAHTSVILK